MTPFCAYVAIALLSVNLSVVMSLRCYIGSRAKGVLTVHDKDCRDLYVYNTPACTKITTYDHVKIIGQTKDCANWAGNMECKTEKTGSVYVETCYCNTDFCNAEPLVTIPAATVAPVGPVVALKPNAAVKTNVPHMLGLGLGLIVVSHLF